LIGPKIPVHGLLLDVETGRLEWVVNGYETLAASASATSDSPNAHKFTDLGESIGAFKEFAIGEMKFPAEKIGQLASHLESGLSSQIAQFESQIGQAPGASETASPPAEPKAPPIHMKTATLPPIKKNPLPPPIRPHANLRRG
jgi:carbonic anhydrase